MVKTYSNKFIPWLCVDYEYNIPRNIFHVNKNNKKIFSGGEKVSILQRIKELANLKEVSLAEIERQAGLSSGSITKWDKSSPSVEKLDSVAKYLNVSVDYLLGNVDSINNNTDSYMAKQVMMRMDTDGLSRNEIDEIEKEMERFFAWRIEEIKKERGEK